MAGVEQPIGRSHERRKLKVSGRTARSPLRTFLLRKKIRFRMQRVRRALRRYERRGLTLGQNVRCTGVPRIGYPEAVTIGNNVGIASNVVFLEHEPTPRHLYLIGAPGADELDDVVLPITIHDDCMIGYGAMILPGVTIGPRSVVAAGAVVASDVPPDTMVVGNPARVATTLPGLVRHHRREADRLAVRATVLEIVGRRRPGAELRDDTALDAEGLGLDSVEIVEIMLECEEVLGIDVPDETLAATTPTIAKLVEVLSAGS